MTKSQIFYYLAVVVIITFFAYLYTTVVNAPEPDSDVVGVNVEVEAVN